MRECIILMQKFLAIVLTKSYLFIEIHSIIIQPSKYFLLITMSLSELLGLN